MEGLNDNNKLKKTNIGLYLFCAKYLSAATLKRTENVVDLQRGVTAPLFLIYPSDT